MSAPLNRPFTVVNRSVHLTLGPVRRVVIGQSRRHPLVQFWQWLMEPLKPIQESGEGRQQSWLNEKS